MKNRNDYQKEWAKERKLQVDKYVRDQVFYTMHLGSISEMHERIKNLKFKRCKELPSESHVKLANSARDRLLKVSLKFISKLLGYTI